MALFLFSVFLMFAVFSSIGSPFYSASKIEQSPAEERAEVRRDFAQERAEDLQKLNGLRAERARLAAAGRPVTGVDARIKSLESKRAIKQRAFEKAIALIDAEEKEEAEKEAKAVAGPAKEAAEQADEGNFVAVAGADSLNAWFNHAYKKAKENPKLLIYKLQSNAYKFSWALIPISVPFLWLLFLHRRRYRQYRAYDHTVFVTYSIAFMSLGMIALSLFRAVGVPLGLIALAIWVVPPVHIYRQLRGAYLLSRFSAIWRTLALIVFAFIAASLFFALLLMLGLLG
jgi:hypothetical protein